MSNEYISHGEQVLRCRIFYFCDLRSFPYHFCTIQDKNKNSAPKNILRYTYWMIHLYHTLCKSCCGRLWKVIPFHSAFTYAPKKAGVARPHFFVDRVNSLSIPTSLQHAIQRWVSPGFPSHNRTRRKGGSNPVPFARGPLESKFIPTDTTGDMGGNFRAVSTWQKIHSD